MDNSKLPEGEVNVCGKWQGTEVVPGRGTCLGSGQRCGSGDSVCGPALSSLQLKQWPEAQASSRACARLSVQLLDINRLSVWSVEALRTPGRDM